MASGTVKPVFHQIVMRPWNRTIQAFFDLLVKG